MKRIVRIVVLASLVTAAPLFAQQGSIAVKKGTTFSYATDTKMDIVQSFQGQEMTMVSNTTGTMELSAKNVTASAIDWNYAIKKLRVTMKAAMLPGGGTDTTMKGSTLSFSTDKAGRISNPEKLAADPMLAAVGGGMQGAAMGQMFSPALARTLTVGQSWEESTIDTIVNPALQGAKILLTKTTRFTYEGTVDTLKTKAARIRTEVTSMTIGGEGSAAGMSFRMDGDGASLGSSYYSVADGLLLASSADMTMNMRLMMTGQMEMVIPMTYALKTTTLRTGK